MREYARHESKMYAQSVGAFSLLNLLRNWQCRRNFARLAKLSDYQLKDIGLSHGDVLRLSRLPLSVNPAWEADRLRLISSRHSV